MEKTPAMVLGQMLRKRRREAGFTQKDLALRVGLKNQQILRYEKGTAQIPAVRLQAIAHALKMPISCFYNKSPPAVSYRVGEPKASEPPPMLEDTIKILMRLPPHVRSSVITLIRFLGAEMVEPGGIEPPTS